MQHLWHESVWQRWTFDVSGDNAPDTLTVARTNDPLLPVQYYTILHLPPMRTDYITTYRFSPSMKSRVCASLPRGLRCHKPCTPRWYYNGYSNSFADLVNMCTLQRNLSINVTLGTDNCLIERCTDMNRNDQFENPSLVSFITARVVRLPEASAKKRGATVFNLVPLSVISSNR
jgi:hypothetical protein